MDEKYLDEKEKRNLHPHAEAFFIMISKGREYSKQGGGVMDFWDKQTECTKDHAKQMVDRILKLPRADCNGEKL